MQPQNREKEHVLNIQQTNTFSYPCVMQLFFFKTLKISMNTYMLYTLDQKITDFFHQRLVFALEIQRTIPTPQLNSK